MTTLLMYFLFNAKRHYADDTALFVSNAYLQGRTLNTITVCFFLGDDSIYSVNLNLEHLQYSMYQSLNHKLCTISRTILLRAIQGHREHVLAAQYCLMSKLKFMYRKWVPL